jgi:hypothetical protein
MRISEVIIIARVPDQGASLETTKFFMLIFQVVVSCTKDLSLIATVWCVHKTNHT